MSVQRSRLTVREYREVLKAICNSPELFEVFREHGLACLGPYFIYFRIFGYLGPYFMD